MGSLPKKKPRFISLTATRNSRALFPSHPVASIKITGNRQLAMTPEVWESLEQPEFLVVAVAPKEDLIQIEKGTPTKVGANRSTGMRKVAYQPYLSSLLSTRNNAENNADEEGYYWVALSSSQGKKPIYEELKTGYYTPIGGGMFKYHGPEAPRR